MVEHAGAGRSWAEGSAVFDSTDPWGTGAQKGNEHPDLSSGGANGTDVPTAEQIACVTEFLNYPDARIDQVFAAIDPNPAEVPEWCTSTQCTDYTIVATADAARGEAWYNDANGGNCLSCHGQPEDAEGPIATGPEGGLLVFLRQDGKYSEFRHKVQWGESGHALMSRANMNEPTAAEVADVLAYLKARIDIQVGQPSGSIAAGKAEWDTTCNVCHSATPYDTTVAIATTDLAGRGAALVDAGLLINNLVETDATMVGQELTDQDILDMVAFLDSL